MKDADAQDALKEEANK